MGERLDKQRRTPEKTNDDVVLVIEEGKLYRPFSPTIELPSPHDSYQTHQHQQFGDVTVDQPPVLSVPIEFNGIRGFVGVYVNGTGMLHPWDKSSTPLGDVKIVMAARNGALSVQEAPLSFKMTFNAEGEEEREMLQTHKVNIICGEERFSTDFRYSFHLSKLMETRDLEDELGKSREVLLPFNAEKLAQIEISIVKDEDLIRSLAERKRKGVEEKKRQEELKQKEVMRRPQIVKVLLQKDPTTVRTPESGRIVIERVSIEEFFAELNKTTETPITIRAHTNYKWPFSITSEFPYVISDGELGPDGKHVNGPTYEVEIIETYKSESLVDSLRIAIGDYEPGDIKERLYFMTTTMKAPELRKILKKLGIKSIIINASIWAHDPWDTPSLLIPPGDEDPLLPESTFDW